MGKSRFFLALIITLGLIIRLYQINLPLIEFNPSRQIQTAEIAKNFYLHDFNIQRPTVSYLGPNLTPFLVEFPGYNFAVALGYLILGFVNEIVGRILSIIGWIVSTYFLYQIAKKYIGTNGALISLFFYTFSPLSVLISRSFQPDQWMLTFSLAAIYFLERWFKNKSFLNFYLSATSVSLAILLKIPAVIFTLIPVLFLIISNSKLGLSKLVKYLLIALLPSLLWYFHAVQVSRAGNSLENNVQVSNWFGFEVFLNPKYYSNIFGFELNLVLLPIGIFLFFMGIVTKIKRGQQFLYFWLAGVVLYFFIFNKHNMTHEYYHLPFLPIASIFIGIGVEKIIQRFNNLVLYKNFLILIFSILIFLAMLPPTLSRAYKPIDRFKHVPETAKAIDRLTKPSDLIIGSMDAGPTLVYYSNRPGWSFEINREDTKSLLAFYGVKNKNIIDATSELEELKSKGAVIFASANKEQFLLNKNFAKYMYGNYETLEESDNYIIFSLSKP